jgi:hypothetical protein
LTIHLAGQGADPERVGGGSIYMHVDDADVLAEEWREAGVDLVEPQDYDPCPAHLALPSSEGLPSARRRHTISA